VLFRSRQTRNAEGFAHILSEYFGCAVHIVEYAGRWLQLSLEQQTRLGMPGTGGQLGVGSVAGRAVWDCQHHFTVRMGPISLADYDALLPGGDRLAQLLDWVRSYIGIEFAWSANLVLRHDEVPKARLGGTARLGWTTWLGRRSGPYDANDLTLDVERLAARDERLVDAPAAGSVTVQ
jgi:type VI secretion system protein ImpH